MPPTSRIDLPQGTLDLLILRAISLQPLHGWAISQRIQQLSSEVLQVPQGSLYPALHRLERRGLVKSSWDVTDNNRRARYYHLTPLGRRQLEKETADWRKLVGAVTQLLETS
jgi:PadR family transcriptional regulator, regulatory protein PadR